MNIRIQKLVAICDENLINECVALQTCLMLDQAIRFYKVKHHYLHVFGYLLDIGLRKRLTQQKSITIVKRIVKE